MSRTEPSRPRKEAPLLTNLVAWVEPILAAHGLTRSSDGYRVEDLAALAADHNWGHATEHRPTTHLDRRWRATVYPLDVPSPQPWITGGKTGNATNETDALAIALARMLAREEREAANRETKADETTADAARAG